MTDEVYYTSEINTSTGSYTSELIGLSEGTTYYYQAFMSVWNGTGYEEIVSEVRSFTTLSATVTDDLG